MPQDESSTEETASFAQASSPPPSAEADVDRFLSTPADRFLIRARDAEEPERRKLLEAALAADPQHIQARVQFADYAGTQAEAAAQLRSAADDAVREFQAAAHVDDALRRARARFDFLVSHSRLGCAERLRGRLHEARDAFEKVLGVDPKDALRARDGLLGCYLELRWYDRARELLERFKEHSGLQQFGQVLMLLDERPDAPSTQKLLELAVEQQPRTAALLVLDHDERARRVQELRAEIDAAGGDPPSVAKAQQEIVEAERAAGWLYGAWSDAPGALVRLAEAVFGDPAAFPASLRPRPALPAARTNEWREKLLAAPQAPAEVWRIEVRRVDCWLPPGDSEEEPGDDAEEAEYARGWLVAVWSYGSEDFRGFLLQGGEPDSEAVLKVFAEAVLDPRGRRAPQPGRPGAVEFSPDPGLASIVEDLASVGVARTPEDGPLPPRADELIRDAMQRAPIDRPEALAAVPGLSLEERKSFYQTASDYALAAPWRKMLRREVVCVEVGGAAPWRRWAAPEGSGTLTGGATITPDLKLFELPATETGDLEFHSFEYGPFHELAPADYDEIVEVHGMSFAKGGWPFLLVCSSDESQTLVPLDVEAATVCLRALAAFADKAGAARRRGFKVLVQYGGRTIEASVKPHGAK